MRAQRYALFDPRPMNRMWPEPNDDPNIPYVWGLSGGLNGFRRNEGEDAAPLAPLSAAELAADVERLSNLSAERELSIDEVNAALDEISDVLMLLYSNAPTGSGFEEGDTPTVEQTAQLTSVAVAAANRFRQNYPAVAEHPVFERPEFDQDRPEPHVSTLGVVLLTAVGIGASLGLLRGFRRGDRGLALAKSTLLGSSVIGLFGEDT